MLYLGPNGKSMAASRMQKDAHHKHVV